ncbi:hypothetical protein BJ165DRAFT_1480500 [Panaeolus papilionaceus]|nr:hypothetical protein BJ165DRAFT_1480500 [Panaeolus papilionaceus]
MEERTHGYVSSLRLNGQLLQRMIRSIMELGAISWNDKIVYPLGVAAIKMIQSLQIIISTYGLSHLSRLKTQRGHSA